jgi:hypothetical protein
MSLKIECNSKNVTKFGMSIKLKCHANWNVTQNGMSIKMEHNSKWKETNNELSLKFECHSNWKTKYIEKVVNPKTSNSASISSS